MPDVDHIFVGPNTELPKLQPMVGPYTKLTVVTGEQDEDGKDIAFSIGTDDGLELEVTNKYADVEGNENMVANMGAIFLGLEYKPFDAENTILDPAAEIGDDITIGSVYSQIYSLVTHFEPLYLAQPAAPFNDEYESEYPYKTKEQRQYSRDKAANRANLKIATDEIRAEVVEVEEGLDTRISQLSIRADGIETRVQDLSEETSSSIEQLSDEIALKVSSAEAEAMIEQGIDDGLAELTLSVTNSGMTSRIALSKDGVEIDSDTVRITGAVTFEDLETSGETTINGDNITTGTISANNIAVEDIATVNRSLLLGGGDENYALIEFGNTDSYTYLRTSHNDDYLTMGGRRLFLNANSYLDLTSNGGDIRLESGDMITLDSAGQTTISADGNLTLSSDVAIELIPGSSSYVQINDVLSGHNSLRPEYDNDLSLGASSYRWSQVYAATSTISTSDREKKKDISYDLRKYDKLFDNLRPASFKFKNGKSGRTHIGLIAQDVEDILGDVGLDAKKFAAFCKDPHVNEHDIPDGTYDYGLRYEEFIGLLIRQVQMLKERVKALEDGNSKTDVGE